MLIHKKDYAAIETPTGVVRPKVLGVRPNDVLPPPQLPYCKGSPHIGPPAKRECKYWDELLVQYPLLEPSSLFLTSFVTNATQVLRGCSLDQPNCQYEDSQSNSFYIPNLEHFRIQIDWAIDASAAGIKAKAGDLHGVLRDTDGDEIEERPGESIGQKGKLDTLDLRTLLAAAGIRSLDDPSPVNESLTIRETGAAIFVQLTFSNFGRFGLEHPHYQYEVEVVNQAPVEVPQLLYTDDLNSRVVWRRHGLRIEFVITGVIGRLYLVNLAHWATTSVALLGAAAVMVDMVSTYLMPRVSGVYRRLRRQRIEDTPTPDEIEQQIGEATPIAAPGRDEHTTRRPF